MGTFSSKALVFLLMPLYTRALTTAEYGVIDLLVQTSNLLLPLVSMGIVNGVIRFGLDRSAEKTDVFTTGLLTILCGFALLLIASPLLNRVDIFEGHAPMLCAFVLTSTLRSLCSQFTRSCGRIRLFALDGILSTAWTLLFNILFLAVFRLGVPGYMLAVICADALSVLFLFFGARLWRYVNFQSRNRALTRAMLRYSLPMIPNSLFWWVINVSDRYMVAWILGEQANGLYAVAYKLPTAIGLAAGIFMDAWQISAVTEAGERERFFSRIFRSYGALVFLAGSALILFARPLMGLLVSESFLEAWRYVPVLVMASVFSCLANFFGSVYMVEKKSLLSLLTTAFGAAANVGLNLLLIPRMGAMGAALATLLSYAAVFLIRIPDTRRFLKIQWGAGRILLNTALLAAQTVVLVSEVPLWPLWESLLAALSLLLNFRELLNDLKRLAARRAHANG